MVKKILLSIWLFILSLVSFQVFAVPSFSSMTIQDVWWYTDNLWVNSNKSLYDNMLALFFPSSWGAWGAIWNKLQTIFVGLLFIFIIWAGALFVLNSKDEGKLKQAKMNLLSIFYWSFLFFGAIWLLWTTLHVWWATNASDTVLNTQNNIIWAILIFFKSAAYYVAIIFVVYYGYKIMQAQEKEDKIKTARTWVLNVIIALIAIKVLDYIYYIAQQASFWKQATNFISSIWTVLGWVLWVIIILVLIYAGFLLVTSRWNEEAMKKSKTIVRNVFLVVFVLFLFIVIVFDLIKNFS